MAIAVLDAGEHHGLFQQLGGVLVLERMILLDQKKVSWASIMTQGLEKLW